MASILRHVTERARQWVQQQWETPRRGGGSPGGQPANDVRTGAAAADRRTGYPASGQPPAGGYPGDFTGAPRMTYEPDPDGNPDPGEVVWTWVPYEEDHSRGKDRPVLLVARDGRWLLGLPLTSKDHDRDARQERAAGRTWTDVGTGAWDPRGRPSEVRTNRVVRVDPQRVRREGGRVDEATFARVAAAVARNVGQPGNG